MGAADAGGLAERRADDRARERLGVDTAAAFGAALQIWKYIQMPAFAVGMAVSAMAAQNVGAQKWDRVNSVARVGVVFSVVHHRRDGAGHRAARPACPGPVPAAAGPSPVVGSHINHMVTWSFIFFGFSMVLFGVVRATGAVVCRC